MPLRSIQKARVCILILTWICCVVLGKLGLSDLSFYICIKAMTPLFCAPQHVFGSCWSLGFALALGFSKKGHC